MGGRHRAQRKPQSRLVLPGLIVLVMPALIVFGYIQLVTQEPIELNTVNHYATAVTVPPTLPSSSSSVPTLAPPSVTVLAAPDPPATTNAPPGPTEKDAGSSLPTSTTPPTQPHRPQDQKAPTASSEAPSPTPAKIKADHKCTNLDSDPKVVRACNAIMAQFPNISSMGGRAARPDNPTSCHPDGLGLDVMVGSNELGDAVNKWVHDHKSEYEIAWTGWEIPDHWDHVHISFEPCKG